MLLRLCVWFSISMFGTSIALFHSHFNELCQYKCSPLPLFLSLPLSLPVFTILSLSLPAVELSYPLCKYLALLSLCKAECSSYISSAMSWDRYGTMCVCDAYLHKTVVFTNVYVLLLLRMCHWVIMPCCCHL